MKFLTCEINHVKNPMYERLLNAWEASVQLNCPNDTYERAYLNPADFPGTYHAKNSYLANSVKLNYWRDRLRDETENVCLIDGDTVVLKDMNHVFDQDFDIAFTRRTAGVRLPINGGVLFVRPSKKLNAFMDGWVEANNRMLVDIRFHREWYLIYNGMNQAAFGYMLAMNARNPKVKIIEVPCAKYNACDRPDWVGINDETHVLHVKSDLRVACIQNIHIPAYSKAINTWKTYERAAVSQTV